MPSELARIPAKESERDHKAYLLQLSNDVQGKIVAQIEDPEEKIEWINAYGKVFRHLFEKDEDFMDLVLAGDIDAIRRRVEEKKSEMH